VVGAKAGRAKLVPQSDNKKVLDTHRWICKTLRQCPQGVRDVDSSLVHKLNDSSDLILLRPTDRLEAAFVPARLNWCRAICPIGLENSETNRRISRCCELKANHASLPWLHGKQMTEMSTFCSYSTQAVSEALWCSQKLESV